MASQSGLHIGLQQKEQKQQHAATYTVLYSQHQPTIDLRWFDCELTANLGRSLTHLPDHVEASATGMEWNGASQMR